MGTIAARKRKDGSTAYLAQITFIRDKIIIHREAKTFDRRPAAAAWIKRREKELGSAPEELGQRRQSREPALADAIDTYVKKSIAKIGRTKAQVLEAIKRYSIAEKRCADIGSRDIVAFAEELSGDRQPQTVANYLSHLSAIFAIARPAWGIPLDQQAMRDAITVCNRLGLTTKSRKRNSRPTLDQLDKIMRHFEEMRARRPDSNPMNLIIAFAIFSTRRQEEITRITWADFEEANSRVLVRDMKHPGQKIGNDIWCDLPAPAVRIIKAMPRGDARIFPFNPIAISAAFTRACSFLGIEDLHFHDLRHDGVSRLFELGMNIPHAAAVSGHRSWQSLQRYTHLRQAGDKYEGWPWLDRIAPLPPPEGDGGPS